MNFIIIGDAANRLPQDVEEECPAIPWHFMRAMRNRLVHDYFEVDEKLLPPLVPELEKLL